MHLLHLGYVSRLKKHGQQGEGGDYAPLFFSGETTPGVLRPALEPPAQDRHGPGGLGPREVTKMVRGMNTSAMRTG